MINLSNNLDLIIRRYINIYVREKYVTDLILNNYYQICFEEFKSDGKYYRWDNISHKPKLCIKSILSENFIRKYYNSVDWEYLSFAQNFSDKFLIDFENFLNWRLIFCVKPVSENIISYILKNCDKSAIYWNIIWEKQKLSESFIINNIKFVNWDLVLKNQKLSEDFIEKYIKIINKRKWDIIFKYQKLSENFIEKHKKKINWEIISKYQLLSENFINKYKSKVDWESICECQNVSENFIQKNNNYLTLESRLLYANANNLKINL